MSEAEPLVEIHVLVCACRRYGLWRYANLSAPYWRVYWNGEPGWRVRLGERTVALDPARLVVIPPETPFSSNSEAPATHLNIHFVVSAPYDMVRPGLYEISIGGHVRSVVGELVQRTRAGTVSTARGDVLLRMLCYHALSVVPVSELSTVGYSPKVRMAMERMGMHDGARLTNPELAQGVGMSTNAFIRLFSRQTGLSPQNWYVRRRIEFACVLLHHSALSIEQIADKTGFHDRAHLSRVFSKLRGMGPGAFRKTAPMA